jgi:hypothetical protein
MPTVFRIGPYRFFFYAGERNEPAHIHIERERHKAKFWLDPVRLEQSGGFRSHEIIRIQGLIQKNQRLLLERWHEYFND